MTTYRVAGKVNPTWETRTYEVEADTPHAALAEVLYMEEFPASVIGLTIYDSNGLVWSHRTDNPKGTPCIVLVGMCAEDLSANPVPLPEPGKKLPPQIFGAYRIVRADGEIWNVPVRVNGAKSALLSFGAVFGYNVEVVGVQGFDDLYKAWTSVHSFAKPLTVGQAVTTLGDNAPLEATLSEVFTPEQSKTVVDAFEKHVNEMLDLHHKKAKDYGSGEDTMANLRGAELLGLPAWVGVVIRMDDKMFRLRAEARRVLQRAAFVASGLDVDKAFASQGLDTPRHLAVGYKDGQANESTEDSFRDLGNYALLGLSLYKEEHNGCE